MGYVPTHWEDSGLIPSQGGLQVDFVEDKDEDGWGLGLTSTGVVDGV